MISDFEDPSADTYPVVERFKHRRFVTQEARRDIAVDLDMVIREQLLSQVRTEGYRPLGDVSVVWTLITEENRAEILGWNILYDPSIGRPGDWEVWARVRAVKEGS